MKTRILIYRLTLASFLPMLAKAQVNYAVLGDTAYVTRSDNATGNIVIASTYNGYPVTWIENAAFYSRTGLTSVTIPGSVESIGGNAFYQCRGLTNVTIGDGVAGINIVGGAFTSCTSLKTITLPSGFITLGSYAFDYCKSLASIAINAGYVGSHAFRDCAGLQTVTLGDGVTGIGTYAFIRCSSLTTISVSASNPSFRSINGVLFDKGLGSLIVFPGGRGGSYLIPGTVASIGQGAFHSCSNLTEVIIPSSLTTIGPYAFVECARLRRISIPDTVTSILDAAFRRCGGLTNVTIGNGVTSIPYSAFEYCNNLTKVTTGNGVTSVGDWAFFSCTRLTNATFMGNAPSLGQNVFYNIAVGSKAYYYYGSTGWGTTYGGLPTVMLGAPAPQVSSETAGVKPGGFGFTVNGVVNQTISVEASTNLMNWRSIWTNTLSSPSTNFVDLQWLNHPRRFYRAR